MNIELLLESITECIRSYRRTSTKFPAPFALSYIKWDTQNRRIEMDLFEDGKIVKYDLLLDRVKEHGETSDVIERNNESV